MKRYSFKMKLKPGCAQEYKRRHENIWPELKQLLSNVGIQDYSIYVDKESHTLFATQKLADSFDGEKLSEHPLMKKWWKYMADLMETNADYSPVCTELKEMFYME